MLTSEGDWVKQRDVNAIERKNELIFPEFVYLRKGASRLLGGGIERAFGVWNF